MTEVQRESQTRERVVAPSYYAGFRCIGGACLHTCCAGWEIDIDEESLARYKKDGLPFISEEETPHFVLKEGDRCPFLNGENLCNLILSRGENYLCQICRDHPRFRNYWTGFIEIGLGLSCEEVCRLILLSESPLSLSVLSPEKGEGSSENSLPLSSLLAGLPEDEAYLWEVRDRLFKRAASFPDPMEQRLMEYFIYRQLPDALYDGFLAERISFIEICIDQVLQLWEKAPDVRKRLNAARDYSEKTEYDTEKINALLLSLSQEETLPDPFGFLPLL